MSGAESKGVDPRIERASWSVHQLDQALPLLARAADLSVTDRAEPVEPPVLGEAFYGWLESSADWLGLETEAVTCTYAEIPEWVRSGGPAILWRSGEKSCLLLLPSRGPGFLLPRGTTHARVLTPEGRIRRLPEKLLIEHLRAPIDVLDRHEIEGTLEQAGVPARRRPGAVTAMLEATHADRPISAGWLLRAAPHTSFGRRLAQGGVGKRFLALLLAHGAQYALWLMAWWLIGRAALGGSLAPGWLAGWILMLLTLVPLRTLSAWLMGDLALRVGTELKGRFLYGALSLDPDRVHADGAGGSLGRVIESESVEAMAMAGGLGAITAALELPIAAWVISQGANAPGLLALLALTVVLLVLHTLRYARALGRSTDLRLAMTHELVEKMVGHRTRLAQETPDERHEGEAGQLDDYLERLEARDRPTRSLQLLPRLWLFLALIGLVPAMAGAAGPTDLAIALGGILLVQSAIANLTTGLVSLAAAGVGWERVLPLFRAGGLKPELGLPSLLAVLQRRGVDSATSAAGDGHEGGFTEPRETSFVVDPEAGGEAEPAPVVLRASRLEFGYPGRARKVIDGGELEIRYGDRILVEGPSGGGKSTLAALLVGLRRPDAGLLTLYGMDRGSVGLPAWRQRVVMVPQFHENHVLTETFAFNLLMGKSWPPSTSDLAEAGNICCEMGLEELLGRMPAGLMQMVGDTGWQLSHGERSRLFLARAILSDADLIVLDESFAALDPENLKHAVSCAWKRGKTIMVIAHP